MSSQHQASEAGVVSIHTHRSNNMLVDSVRNSRSKYKKRRHAMGNYHSDTSKKKKKKELKFKFLLNKPLSVLTQLNL